MMTAPQLGLWSGMAPKTDNPANARRVGPPSEAVRQRLRELRDMAAAHAAARRKSAPGVWK